MLWSYPAILLFRGHVNEGDDYVYCILVRLPFTRRFVCYYTLYTQTASLFVEDSRVGPFKNDFIHNNYSTIHNNYLERKWIRNPKNSVEMTSKVVCIRYVCYIHMSAYVCILLRMLHTTRRNDPVYVITTVCS